MAETSAEFDVDPQFVENVKYELIGVYKEVSDKLSDDVFSDFLELLRKDDVVVKMDAAVMMFKTILLDEMVNSFDRMWQSKDISQSLFIMEQLKKKFQNCSEPQWRPYGRSALEQTLPLRVKVLQKREKYLEGILGKQKSQLESMVSQIEENRKLFEEHIARRNALVDQMDLRLKKLGSARKELLGQELIAALDKLL